MRRASPLLVSAFLLPGLVGLFLAGCPSNNGGSTPSSSSTGTGGSHPTGTSGTTGTSSTSGTVASSSSSSGTSGVGGGDAGTDGPYPVPLPDSGVASPCTQPGSVVFTANGTIQVGGGSPSWPSLSFLHLPAGFCAHYYGTVGNARQIRFAPGGELFVASPTAGSTGGGCGGQNAFLVLPDDNHDGVADANLTFLSFGAPTTCTTGSPSATNQGMLFATGFFYYQDGTPPGTKIMRMPYKTGDRTPSGASAQVADITVYTSGLHWPKTMDIADDGTLYVGNGGDQGESCTACNTDSDCTAAGWTSCVLHTCTGFHGGILKVDAEPGGPNPGGVQVARGFRNPISVRCQRGHDQCFALELAKDYTYGAGGREKMVPIRQGDDWGFPCCATANLPYQGNPTGTNCSSVAVDTNSWYIGDTPFGLDFEPGTWPSPWTNAAFVATHGAAGSWQGARIVAIATDPTTGMPLPSTNMNNEGVDTGSMTDFATGWYDTTTQMATGHGRPASLTFSGDGRLFVANDNNGVIFWIAPVQP